MVGAGRIGRGPLSRVVAALAVLVAVGPVTVAAQDALPDTTQNAVRGTTTARDRARLAIEGFATGSAAAQRALEAAFLSGLSADSARANARRLARSVHVAGTDAAHSTARWLADTMERLGFAVTVERYDVYLPHPVTSRVTLVDGEPEVLGRALPTSPGADGDTRFSLAWNAYGANGSVSAPVVYANYGLPEDYDSLARLGVEVEDRIVLARYGRSFRGVKAAVAERHGARGLILYSDPAEDGFAAGDTLPDGPYRPSDAVQRGTVKYLWRYTGDPLTPGRPARPGVERLDPEDATDLPRIPVAPLGYGAASSILRAMDGPRAPGAFQGGLDFEYRVGSGETTVRLEVEQSYALRPIRNVIARLPGASSRSIVIGNHYDAWLYGGVDPHSGTAAVLEIARGLSTLRDGGWSPRRGITIAFWDAEEYGAVGSTEWVEQHVDRLRREAVAYFNIDVFTAGTLQVSGVPSLRALVASAAEAVPDPMTGRTLADAWRARVRQASEAGDVHADGRPIRLAPLGAGSDWTAFFHFAGVPSLQWTMNGRGTYAVYHARNDDFAYYRRFADSAFVHTPAIAGAMGVAALRLAEAEALPFRYSDYADRIAGHLDSLAAEAERWAGDGRAVELARHRRLVEDLRAAAAAVEARQRTALAAGDAATLRRIDRTLPAVEQAFLDPDGQPGRSWYRHRIYTPGRTTGYASVPLPGPTEALRRGEPAALEHALDRLAAALGRAIRALRNAAPTPTSATR